MRWTTSGCTAGGSACSTSAATSGSSWTSSTAIACGCSPLTSGTSACGVSQRASSRRGRLLSVGQRCAASGCRPSPRPPRGSSARGPGRPGRARQGRASRSCSTKPAMAWAIASGPISPSAHIFSPSSRSSCGSSCGEDLRGLIVFEQHHHHRGAVGLAECTGSVMRAASGAGRRQASGAAPRRRCSGFSATILLGEADLLGRAAPDRCAARRCGRHARRAVRDRPQARVAAGRPVAAGLPGSRFSALISGRTPSSSTSSTASSATPLRTSIANQPRFVERECLVRPG